MPYFQKKRSRAALLCVTLCAALCLMLPLASCGKDPDGGEQTTTARSADPSPHGLAFYETLDSLDTYIRLGAYTGLTVSADGEQTAEEAVWAAVLAEAEGITVPESEIAYYFNSLQAQYRYYASLEELSYGELLTSLGLSEDSLWQEAYEMARKDLLFAAVLRHSGISLTEAERTSLFDRYVNKFVTDYGYSREYVSSSMEELIYETMLYDKVTEYLLTENTVQ